MNRKNFQSGFTLIEILVVFSLIAILALIGVAAFVNYSRVASLQSAASDLSSAILLAKSSAGSQVKPQNSRIPQCNSTTSLNGYKIVLCPTSSSNVICNNNNSYIISVICSSSNCSDSLCSNITPQKVQESILPENITFGSGSTESLFFPVISGGVGGAGTIILQGYGNTKTITVDSIGGIRIQ